MSEGLRELEAARERLASREGTYGRSLTLVAETGSTNDDARAAADAGAPRGHVVVADAQRSGRGARGSVWSSPAGRDLYVSIVERVSLTPRALSVLTLAVGLGVRDACVSILGPHAERSVTVKWPNDVRVAGRKCAGILVESSSVGERIGPIVIGIGLDVNRDAWPDALREIATSLAAVRGAPIDRAEALLTLLACVEARVELLVHEGPEAIVRALRPHLAWVGERVRVDAIEGVLEGIDDEGVLLVRQSNGEVVRARSGTLRLLG
ncbi:MAG: biotin--[acetyl-CoA-carboxylase] ligase [Deltaproteobacteria bacterium]|nr:biotin--[acetyl-CoA-carboxylase] ligase [Deltaproteobacteria bacterium]